jgi:acyl dehydratase
VGDWNPLHVDPVRAAIGGYPKPILPGLCTYGVTAKAIYEKYCDNDPRLFKKMAARFTSHIFPGETLVINMWREGNIVIYEGKTKERRKVVIIG